MKQMHWPRKLTVVRHGQSAGNVARDAAMQANVDFQQDILNGVIKSAVFALIVTWIALHKGFDAVPTSEGISQATTQTVVTSSLAVLGFDFILTAVMFGG